MNRITSLLCALAILTWSAPLSLAEDQANMGETLTVLQETSTNAVIEPPTIPLRPVVFNDEITADAVTASSPTSEALQAQSGANPATPSKEEIQRIVKDYVAQQTEETETFDIYDPLTEEVGELTLEQIRDEIGKTGEYYFVCADFKDVDTGDKLDVDFDIEDLVGQLTVVDSRIHKVNGVPRYTYDDKNNRMPVPVTVPSEGSTDAPEDAGNEDTVPSKTGQEIPMPLPPPSEEKPSADGY